VSGPLRVAVIGMGGFAGVHHDAVLKLEAEGACRLLCTCDPQMAAFAARQAALRFPERGVRLFADYRDMLAACRADLDVVTVPTPVPLHAPMHQAAVEAGLAVYLEKPPTLDWAELDRMLAVEARARRLTNVGFNFIIEPARQALKRRLAAGEFGAVRRVTVRCRWPRGTSYYGRAAWAGRLLLEGRLVLDSCLGNATAHYVHNALFWCGREPWTWGEVAEVEAELFRAHAIQGADTFFVRARTADGIEVRLALSHACAGAHETEERVVCEKATLYYGWGRPNAQGQPQPFWVDWADGRTEAPTMPDLANPLGNLRAYFAYLRGETDRPLTRLVDSRPFVHLNDLAYLAAGRIVPVPECALARSTSPDGKDRFVQIIDLDAAQAQFIAGGLMLTEQGFAWAAPGGRATPADLPYFDTVIRAMACRA
jgi:predicted dehydrogenase